MSNGLSGQASETRASERPARFRGTPLSWALWGGVLFIGWVVICYLLWTGRWSNSGTLFSLNVKRLGLILMDIGWICFILGTTAGYLAFHGVRGVRSRPALSITVLVLDGVICIGVLVAVFLFLGFVAGG